MLVDKAVQEAHKAGLSSSDSEEELDDEDDFMAKKMGILGEKEVKRKLPHISNSLLQV